MKIIHDKKLKKFIVYTKNQKKGYLKYSFPKDASAKNGNRNIMIDYIYVDPRYRRQGIASELISQLLKYAKKMVWVSLWTGRESEINKTFSLYKKHGFEQKVVQSDYYEPGIPTRLFVKKITK